VFHSQQFAFYQIKKQHVCIKFCIKPGDTAIETEPNKLQNLTFREEKVNRPQTSDSFSKFKNGVSSVNAANIQKSIYKQNR
jgi:hypothetical protein